MGILLLLVVGVGVAVFVWLLVGALRSGRQLPDSKASDLERADDTQERGSPMLGRYWPGPW